jgi:hypothetical protein
MKKKDIMKAKNGHKHNHQKHLTDEEREQQLQAEKAASELKRRVFAELKIYRKKYGLGCFQEISEATRGKVAIGTIANMYTGTRVHIDIWQQVGDALEKLRSEGKG